MSRLDSSFAKDKLLEIQSKKAAADEDNRLLVDGSLPSPGPFDSPTETIAMACKASESWRTLQLIYELVVIKAPRVVVELGTNLGFSTSYIASALKTVSSGGIVSTVDASPYRIRFARELHRGLGLDNVTYSTGLFSDILPELLRTIPSLDFAFIDGQHDYEPTLDFLELLGAKASEGAVFLFDDVATYSDEMRSAWAAIRQHPRVHSWAEFEDVGMAVIRKAAQDRF